MGRTLTATSQMTPMWRLADDAGEAINTSDDGRLKLVEPEGSEYAMMIDGLDTRLRLSGVSEFFDMDSQFSIDPVKKVRVEFLVLKVSGGGNAGQTMIGKRFSGLYSPTVGTKSNLGALLGRLRDRDIERGEEIDIDDFIGTEFVAPIVVNEKGYAEIVPKTIKRGKTVLPFLNGNAPLTPNAALQDRDRDADELASVAAGGDAGDPFEGAEDDL